MAKPASLQIRLENIPEDLKAIPRWVLWKYVPVALHDGRTKWNKMPCQLNGNPAKSTDPSTWAEFDQVVDAFTLGDFDGIGITIDGSDDFHGIDIDDCVVDGKLNATAKELLQKVAGYAEVSPSGSGIKLFTRSNLAISGAKKPIEVYRDGRYFTVTGHRIKGHTSLPADEQDVTWFVERHFGKVSAVDGDSDALALYRPPLPDWDIDRVKDELLPHIKDLESYEGWLKVGMALHHQGQGAAEWMEAWDDVSKGTETYNRKELEDKWESFSEQRGRGAGALTLASLIKEANEARAEERKARFDELKERISAEGSADDLKSIICAEIQKDTAIDRLNRDVLAQLLKTRFKALGYPVSLPEVKRLLKPKSTLDLPHWLQDWVYITHQDVFFNLTSKRKVSVAGFNAMFNREVGGMDTETKAAVLALDLFKIPTPDKIIYLPSAPELFDLNTVPCANGYDPNSPPDVPGEYSKGCLEAIDVVKAHLAMILVEPNAVETMIAWMAHNVQKPGVKIRWAPLVKGIEGDGKSVIGKLMGMVMGKVNVGTVSPSVLATQFTGWADGRCVNVLEEIRMVGHNRHDILNMVKPYITNDVITVHPKGVNEYIAPNTVNYIAFTNHADALPLDTTDRRWWVLFTPFVEQSELAEVAGPDYFDRLHDAIERHAGGLRRWLLEHPIPDWFAPNGQAPKSAAKAQMVSLNTPDEEVVIRELIAQGAPGVHREVVSTSHLSNALAMMEDVDVPRTTAMSRMLAKLGYAKVTRLVKWGGRPIRLWVKGNQWDSMDEAKANAKIRKLLDSTLVDDLLS